MHEFALYAECVDKWQLFMQSDAQCSLHDAASIHRLRRVVRLEQNDSVILFGRLQAARCVLTTYAHDNALFRIVERWKIVPLQPTITLYLPLLERAAFEAAVEAATVLGAAHIIPIVTARTKRAALPPNELERLRRSMIAAAEQSKQFYLPEIAAPQPLAHAVTSAVQMIFFDAVGALPAERCLQLATRSEIAVLIGPEGDLTAQERQLLINRGVSSYKLTPSILRSEVAVMVGLGLLRSLLHAR